MDIGGLEVGMVEEKDKKSAGVNIVNSDKRVIKFLPESKDSSMSSVGGERKIRVDFIIRIKCSAILMGEET